MTLPEAAELIGLSPTTLRVQIRNGRLQAVKRGRDWMVTRKAIAEYREKVARSGGGKYLEHVAEGQPGAKAKRVGGAARR